MSSDNKFYEFINIIKKEDKDVPHIALMAEETPYIVVENAKNIALRNNFEIGNPIKGFGTNKNWLLITTTGILFSSASEKNIILPWENIDLMLPRQSLSEDPGVGELLDKYFNAYETEHPVHKDEAVTVGIMVPIFIIALQIINLSWIELFFLLIIGFFMSFIIIPTILMIGVSAAAVSYPLGKFIIQLYHNIFNRNKKNAIRIIKNSWVNSKSAEDCSEIPMIINTCLSVYRLSRH